MDWTSVVVGALVGGLVGVLMQNMMFPSVQRRLATLRAQTFYARSNRRWSSVERHHPSLVLLQAGSDHEGCFPEGSVVLRLRETFTLGQAARELRDTHSAAWEESGLVDGEQIGIASIAHSRTSDEPADELSGRSHQLTLTVHRYRYFDFLATHRLRLLGPKMSAPRLRPWLAARIQPNPYPVSRHLAA